MLLEQRNCAHLLELSLEEAFELQAALTKAIGDMTKLTTQAAVEGRQIKQWTTHASVGGLTYTHEGRHYPSSLTVVVEVGER